MSKKVPEQFLFIIGAMKSGTTSLFDILGQHPMICCAKMKEPDFFIQDRSIEEKNAYLDLWDWDENTHKYAMEASVAYTKSPYISAVPDRIAKSDIGKYRFIYVLRDPLARIESQVRHGLYAGWGKSLDEGLTEDLLCFSSYAMQIENYLRFFKKDDILVFTLEEFKSQPGDVLLRICDFLEIDNNFEFSDVETPRNSGQLFNVSPGMARAIHGTIGQYISNKFLKPKFKQWIRDKFLVKLIKNKPDTQAGRWKLSQAERADILGRLRSDMDKLKNEFGVDIENYWDMH